MIDIILIKIDYLTKELLELKRQRSLEYKVSTLTNQTDSLFNRSDGQNEQLTDIQEQMVETAYQEIIDGLED